MLRDIARDVTCMNVEGTPRIRAHRSASTHSYTCTIVLGNGVIIIES